MRQLTITKHQSQFDEQPSILELQFDRFIGWDLGHQVLEQVLLQQGFTITEVLQGADRTQWRLDFDSYPVMFHAEFLSQSFWFEFDDEVTHKAVAMGFER